MKKYSIKFVLRWMAVVSLIASILWLLFIPSLEAALSFFAALATLLTSTVLNETQEESGLSNSQINRKRILEKVKTYWIKRTLDSVLESGLIQLNFSYKSEFVSHPLDTRYTIKNSTTHQLVDVFEKLGGEFLLLGNPGSGKTTSLLLLARELIERAEANTTLPIPIILNLSPWQVKKFPLFEWIIAELHNKYQVPIEISSHWLRNNEICLLLDGLDDIEEKNRQACVNAINEFRSNHGLINTVITSRVQEYTELKGYLVLAGAIEIEKLTEDQIHGFLTSKHGTKSTEVFTQLIANKNFKGFFDYPLFLHIFSEVYESINPDQLSSIQSSQEFIDILFRSYVEEMLQRDSPPKTKYSPTKTKYWLSFLARKMKKHNTNILLIENLQPSWLNKVKEIQDYLTVSRLVIGVILGICLFMLIQPVTSILFITAQENEMLIPERGNISLLILSLGILIGFGNIIFWNLAKPNNHTLYKLSGVLSGIFIFFVSFWIIGKFSPAKFNVVLLSTIFGVIGYFGTGWVFQTNQNKDLPKEDITILGKLSWYLEGYFLWGLTWLTIAQIILLVLGQNLLYVFTGLAVTISIFFPITLITISIVLLTLVVKKFAFSSTLVSLFQDIKNSFLHWENPLNEIYSPQGFWFGIIVFLVYYVIRYFEMGAVNGISFTNNSVEISNYSLFGIQMSLIGITIFIAISLTNATKEFKLLDEFIEKQRPARKLSIRESKDLLRFFVSILITFLFTTAIAALILVIQWHRSYKLISDNLSGSEDLVTILLLSAFLGGFMGVFKQRTVSQISVPNQGIREAISNAGKVILILVFITTVGLEIIFTFAGGFTTVLVGLLMISSLAGSFSSSVQMSSVPAPESITQWQDVRLSIIPIAGSITGLCIGIIISFRFGLSTFIQHYSLRLVLFIQKYIPWDIENFLEYCVGCALLRKVGGGYMFFHPFLLDYFAEQNN